MQVTGLIPEPGDPLGKSSGHSSVLAWENPMDRESGGIQFMGSQGQATEHTQMARFNLPSWSPLFIYQDEKEVKKRGGGM